MVRNKLAISEIMPDFAGHVIDNGRLKLLDSLGSGAYGKVYRAVSRTPSKTDRKHYAVKCLCKPKAGSYQEDFQRREFSIHRLLNDHPNIVKLHKVISDEFFIYVILDLYTGGDLFTAITERQIFLKNDKLVKRTFVQIIDAVQYCHERGVFHRDIKPENVLLSGDGSRICLADFGLSTMERVCSDFGCGSSYYMSPECIGQEIRCGRYSTRQSDIWSLGVILTNMISGRNPWRYATTKDECFAAYLHDNDFLRKVLPISDGANTILKRIFKLNPLCRISLLDLRNEILKLDTFFLANETRGNDNDTQKQCHEVDRPSTNLNQGSEISRSTPKSSLSSDEQYQFRSPQVDEQIYSEASPDTYSDKLSTPGPNTYPVPATRATPSTVDDIESVSSGQESEGPITPVTKACDPKILVPDIGDEIGVVCPISTSSAEATGTSKMLSRLRKPFAKRTQLLRLAVTRLTGPAPGEESK
ncbi:serine/threonine protein kinase, negative regulator of sexual conjugation and meiosis [Amanita muscaria]